MKEDTSRKGPRPRPANLHSSAGLRPSEKSLSGAVGLRERREAARLLRAEASGRVADLSHRRQAAKKAERRVQALMVRAGFRAPLPKKANPALALKFTRLAASAKAKGSSDEARFARLACEYAGRAAAKVKVVDARSLQKEVRRHGGSKLKQGLLYQVGGLDSRHREMFLQALHNKSRDLGCSVAEVSSGVYRLEPSDPRRLEKANSDVLNPGPGKDRQCRKKGKTISYTRRDGVKKDIVVAPEPELVSQSECPYLGLRIACESVRSKGRTTYLCGACRAQCVKRGEGNPLHPRGDGSYEEDSGAAAASAVPSGPLPEPELSSPEVALPPRAPTPSLEREEVGGLAAVAASIRLDSEGCFPEEARFAVLASAADQESFLRAALRQHGLDGRVRIHPVPGMSCPRIEEDKPDEPEHVREDGGVDPEELAPRLETAALEARRDYSAYPTTLMRVCTGIAWFFSRLVGADEEKEEGLFGAEAACVVAPDVDPDAQRDIPLGGYRLSEDQAHLVLDAQLSAPDRFITKARRTGPLRDVVGDAVAQASAVINEPLDVRMVSDRNVKRVQQGIVVSTIKRRYTAVSYAGAAIRTAGLVVAMAHAGVGSHHRVFGALETVIALAACAVPVTLRRRQELSYIPHAVTEVMKAAMPNDRDAVQRNVLTRLGRLGCMNVPDKAMLQLTRGTVAVCTALARDALFTDGRGCGVRSLPVPSGL